MFVVVVVCVCVCSGGERKKLMENRERVNACVVFVCAVVHRRDIMSD